VHSKQTRYNVVPFRVDLVHQEYDFQILKNTPENGVFSFGQYEGKEDDHTYLPFSCKITSTDVA
jgi:hypothetical protein